MRTVVAVLVCLAVGVQGGGIDISRTITSLLSGASGTVTASSGCSSTDQYGSNDCSFSWGQTVTIKVNATLPEAVTKGATIDVDAKLDGFIGWKFTCPVCGDSCTVEIPIVRKKETFQLPPCPLVAAGPYTNTSTFTLPSKSPSPISAKVKGTATVKDAQGKLLVAVSYDGQIQD